MKILGICYHVESLIRILYNIYWISPAEPFNLYSNYLILWKCFKTHKNEFMQDAECGRLKELYYQVVNIKVEVKSVCKQTVCLHFELLYF
jgi:hypothetical protein